MTSTTTLVLCGGKGTRLRSVVGDLPKILAPISGRPFAEYLFDYLREQGLTDVVLCTGFGAEQVRSQCRDGAAWGVQVRYAEETTPLGTGGAIKNAEKLIASNPFMVLNGDSVVRADLPRLLKYHHAKKAQLTLGLTPVPDRQRFGSVILNEDGAVAGYQEKGLAGPGLISAGIYVMDTAVLGSIPVNTAVSVEHEVFPKWIGRGLYGVSIGGPFIDIGTPDSLASAAEFLHRPAETR